MGNRYRITTKRGDILVPGYVSDVPGLVITKVIDNVKTVGGSVLEPKVQAVYVKPAQWQVTHLLTGYSCTEKKFASVDEAKRFALAIKDVVDWSTATLDFFRTDEGLAVGRKVAQTYNRLYPPLPPIGSADDFLEELLEGTGWSTDGFGLDSILICKCGNRIEQDGSCPVCGPSPLRAAGLI